MTRPVVHANGDHAQYLAHTFRCRYLGGEAHVADDESLEVRWCPVDTLPEKTSVLTERIFTALHHEGPVRLTE